MHEVSLTVRSLTAIPPAGRLRFVLLGGALLILAFEVFIVAIDYSQDLAYRLWAIPLVIGITISYYLKNIYWIYLFCGALILGYTHLPDTFSLFYLATFFGLPLAVLMASSKQLIFLGVTALLLFFDGFYNQNFLTWFLVSLALFTISFCLPLALRVTWEQKQATANEYNQFQAQVAEANQALARELHDTVARHISVIGLAAHQALYAESDGTKNSALHTIEETTHKALADMRLLIRTARTGNDITGLPETSSAAINLKESLSQTLKHLTNKGFIVDSNIAVDIRQIPEGVRPTLHKIIQEIQFNAEKYAEQGSTVSFTLKPNLTGITIASSNPVKSRLEKEQKHLPSTGYGLVGIEERIRRLGGTMNYGATNETWSLIISLPLAAS